MITPKHIAELVQCVQPALVEVVEAVDSLATALGFTPEEIRTMTAAMLAGTEAGRRAAAQLGITISDRPDATAT